MRGHRFQEATVRRLTRVAVALLVVLTVGVGGCEVGGVKDDASASTSGPETSVSLTAAVPIAGDVGISSGGFTTCVVRPTGQLVCWGDNSAAQLGAGFRSPSQHPMVVAGHGAAAVGVTSGLSHTCAVTSTGRVRCWGANGNGQLGDGSTIDSAVPVEVVGLGSGVLAVSAGSGHTCALTSAGGVKCWGLNASGQLGDGTRVDRAAPSDVAGLSAGVVGVSAGSGHTCAVISSGAVKCWGDNASGQVGEGRGHPTPDGDGDEGQLTTGSPNTIRVTPSEVAGLGSGVASVSAGNAHTCAVMSAGAVKCWGENTSGELGAGTLPRFDRNGQLLAGVASSGVPVDVIGLESAMVGVTAGRGQHTCALSGSGDVSCWGDNYGGQLGYNPLPAFDASGVLRPGVTGSDRPLRVAQLGMRAAAVTAGIGHTCALSEEGDVRCWGRIGAGLGGIPAATQSNDMPVVDVRWPRPPLLPTVTTTLNLIVLGSDTAAASGVDPNVQASQAAIGERLIASDQVLLDAIRAGIRGATWGRLDPRLVVSIAIMPVKAARDCVEYVDDPQLIEAAAEPYLLEGAINVAVAPVTMCLNDGMPVGGYDNPETMPVVGWAALVNSAELVHVILHEVGHDLGLKHAGEVSCADPITVTECELFATADTTSVMSYTPTDAFTAPELYLLGWLSIDEVATSGLGDETVEVHLADLSDEGTKLLVVQLGDQANEDTAYVSSNAGSIELRVDADVPGRQFVTKDTNYSGSLAVMARDAEPVAGEVLLRRAGATISYAGLDMDAKPVIRVTRGP